MPFSETITFLCKMQVLIALLQILYCFFPSNNTPDTLKLLFFTSEHIPEFSDIKKQCQVCYLKEKNNIEFTHAELVFNKGK